MFSALPEWKSKPNRNFLSQMKGRMALISPEDCAKNKII